MTTDGGQPFWNQTPANINEAIVSIESLLAWEQMYGQQVPYDYSIVMTNQLMLDILRKLKYLYETKD